MNVDASKDSEERTGYSGGERREQRIADGGLEAPNYCGCEQGDESCENEPRAPVLSPELQLVCAAQRFAIKGERDSNDADKSSAHEQPFGRTGRVDVATMASSLIVPRGCDSQCVRAFTRPGYGGGFSYPLLVVVNFRSHQGVAIRVSASGHKHGAIAEQRGRVPGTHGGHVGSSGERTGRGIKEFGT